MMMRIAILGIAGLTVWAQPSRGSDGSDDQTIVYELITGEFTSSRPKPVKQNDIVVLKVTNVNPFLYTGEINGTTIAFHTEIPNVIATAILGAKPAAEEEAKRGKKSFSNYLFCFQQALHKLQIKKSIEDILRDVVLNSASLSMADLQIDCEKSVKDVLAPDIKLKESYKILSQFDLAASRVERTFLALKQHVEDNRDQLTEGEKDDFDKAEAQYATYLTEKSAVHQKFINAASLFSRVSNLKDSDYVLHSRPIQAKGDLIRWSVEIKRAPNVDPKYPTPHTFKDERFLETPVLGGLKIDFSSGVFFSSLRDESFSTETDEAGDKIIVRDANGDDFTPVLGALIHVYKKRSMIYNVAASFGAGLRGDNINYFLGPSLILGGERRWIVSAGWIGGKYKRLAAGFEVGDRLEGEDSTVATEDKLRHGFFVGFTFNFSGGESVQTE